MQSTGKQVVLSSYRGPPRGGLVLCVMRKIHLLAMCYVSFVHTAM